MHHRVPLKVSGRHVGLELLCRSCHMKKERATEQFMSQDGALRVFRFLGQDHFHVQVSDDLAPLFRRIGQHCMDAQRDINEVMKPVIESFVKGMDEYEASEKAKALSPEKESEAKVEDSPPTGG